MSASIRTNELPNNLSEKVKRAGTVTLMPLLEIFAQGLGLSNSQPILAHPKDIMYAQRHHES
jgi:hypothetical protein